MSREHLGERLSALIDGELGHAERDRALSHLAACEPCRFEADLLRRLKRRLSGLDAPGPSGDFLGRLSALGEDEYPGGPPDQRGAQRPPGPAAFGTRPPLGSSRPIGGSAPLGRSGPDAARAVQDPPREERRRGPHAAPAPRLRWPQPPHWGAARYALAGASVVAVALGGAFVAGGESAEAPVVRPALEDYAAEHALTAGRSSLPAAEAPPGQSGAPAESAAERGTAAEPASDPAVRPDPAPRAW
ncbi:zf-HC2 domain-containing protein [Nocardiopsis coralliicola]